MNQNISLLPSRFLAFLEKISDESEKFKTTLKERLMESNEVLFSKKTVDDCIEDIKNMKNLSSSIGIKRKFSNSSRSFLFVSLFIICTWENIKKIPSKDFNENDWKEINDLLPGIDRNFIWKNNLKSKKYVWNKEKDEILMKIMRKKYSTLFKAPLTQNNRIRWKEICSLFKAEVNNKSDTYKLLGKHCRERWINHLNPQIKKGEWSKEEDIRLLSMALKYKRRWCLIANTIQNRSQHAIKNRFFQIVSGYLKISNKNSIKRRNFVNDLTQILLDKFNVAYVPCDSEKKDSENDSDKSENDSQEEDQTSKKDLEISKTSGSKTTEMSKEKPNTFSTLSETLKKPELPEKNIFLKEEEKKTTIMNEDHLINKKMEMEKPKELFNFNQPLNISCQNHRQHEGTMNNIFWQHYQMQRNLLMMQNFVLDSERRMLNQQFQQFSRMMGLNGQYMGNF